MKFILPFMFFFFCSSVYKKKVSEKKEKKKSFPHMLPTLSSLSDVVANMSR